MNEQAPATKSRATGNVALIGLVLGLLGAFLIWRGNNLDSPSTIGFLLVLVALAFLLAALVQRIRRK